MGEMYFTPTLVVTGISGSTTVVRKCYGAMTPERAAREKTEVQYRADQLNPAKIEKPRERDYVLIDDEEPTFRNIAQMGRRR